MCSMFYLDDYNTIQCNAIQSSERKVLCVGCIRVSMCNVHCPLSSLVGTVSRVWDVKCLSRFISPVGSRRAVGRLDKFLHEDLKIVGCKIKRYFKMCLPVFIGSIKASFWAAFWPLRSGGHFYSEVQSMKTWREWFWICDPPNQQSEACSKLVK